MGDNEVESNNMGILSLLTVSTLPCFNVNKVLKTLNVDSILKHNRCFYSRCCLVYIHTSIHPYMHT